MNEGLGTLHAGAYNTMQQERQPDGSVKITLIDDKSGAVYRLRVRDLYGPNEEEVDYATGEPIAQ